MSGGDITGDYGDDDVAVTVRYAYILPGLKTAVLQPAAAEPDIGKYGKPAPGLPLKIAPAYTHFSYLSGTGPLSGGGWHKYLRLDDTAKHRLCTGIYQLAGAYYSCCGAYFTGNLFRPAIR